MAEIYVKIAYFLKRNFRDRCYDFFAEKNSENIGVFVQTTASFC
jgi:predicted DCC family thiol-disulfide oxidoreductase YuxK